jgi:ATP-dependent Clp protease ATP-binding subunit ClpC
MLKQELENHFRPEFLNRVDEVVVFHKLTHKDMTKIVDLELSKVQKRLKQHGLILELTEEAREFLLEKGTDEKFGARPLRRSIEQHVEDPLSENILRGMFKGQNKVLACVTEQDGERKLRFEPVEAAQEAKGELAGAGASEAT